MKWIIYLRVSTDEQSKSGLGIEAQRSACMKYINQHASNLDETVEFVDEGLSGTLDVEERQGLFQAINELKKGDVFVVQKRDRLGRDSMINATLERMILKKKCRLVSASGDTQEGTDPTSKLMRQIIDNFSEYEVGMIRQRTKHALQVKSQRGERTGTIPYGFQLSCDGVHLELCESEQICLRMIYSLRDEGFSLSEIAESMNEVGHSNRLGSPWRKSAVQRLVESRDRKSSLERILV